jgi:hypothetical protein
LRTKSVTNPKGEVSKLNGKGRSGEPNFTGQTADGIFFSYNRFFFDKKS